MGLPRPRRLCARGAPGVVPCGARRWGEGDPCPAAFAVASGRPRRAGGVRRMSFAMFRVMALELWRDLPALLMTFCLPSLVFLIFSAVFSSATGADVKLQVALADLARTSGSRRLEAALLADRNLRAREATPATLAGVRAEVRAGRADAGLVIRADPGA